MDEFHAWLVPDSGKLTEEQEKLLCAWFRLTQGKATEEQQKLIVKLMAPLVKKVLPKCDRTIRRNMTMDYLIKRFDISQGKALKIVAESDSISLDSVRKPYSEWKNLSDKAKSSKIARWVKGEGNYRNFEEEKRQGKRFREIITKYTRINFSEGEGK